MALFVLKTWSCAGRINPLSSSELTPSFFRSPAVNPSQVLMLSALPAIMLCAAHVIFCLIMSLSYSLLGLSSLVSPVLPRYFRYSDALFLLQLFGALAAFHTHLFSLLTKVCHHHCMVFWSSCPGFLVLPESAHFSNCVWNAQNCPGANSLTVFPP